VNTTDNVLERNNNASRDGLFVQAKLTKAAVPMMAADATFNTGAKFTGNMWASPLYLAPAAAGGKGLFFAVTTGNDIYAIDETTGATVWTKNLGTPAQANGVSCGNIHPLGILSTPVIDAATRTIYVAGAIGNASTIQKHVISAYKADDGAAVTGWPVDTTGLTSGSLTFTAPPQNQRSALSLVGGKLYVGYGGHIGDCGAYHGWIVAVDTADPTKKAGWATLGQGEAIWAAGGFASDGTSIFPVTGNHTGSSGGDSRTTADSEAVVRLTGMATFTRNDQNLYFPTSWKTMDTADADLGGSNSVLLSVAGATPPNYVAAVAKDGNMYLLNPTNLGGMGGHVLTFKVSSGGAMAVKTSPTAYKTAKGTHYVFSTDSGAVCPSAGGGKSIVSVLLKAGTDGKPTATSEWCAPLTGAVLRRSRPRRTAARMRWSGSWIAASSPRSTATTARRCSPAPTLARASVSGPHRSRPKAAWSWAVTLTCAPGPSSEPLSELTSARSAQIRQPEELRPAGDATFGVNLRHVLANRLRTVVLARGDFTAR